METYAIKNLSFRYPETGIDVLKDITFSVNEGEFITVCGPSGCGKSTLLRHLKPDLSPHGVLSGEIFLKKNLYQTFLTGSKAVKSALLCNHLKIRLLPIRYGTNLLSDLKVLVMTTIQSEKELPKQLHFSESKIILKKCSRTFGRTKANFKPCFNYGNATVRSHFG